MNFRPARKAISGNDWRQYFFPWGARDRFRGLKLRTLDILWSVGRIGKSAVTLIDVNDLHELNFYSNIMLKFYLVFVVLS